jgi:hypothetical protein
MNRQLLVDTVNIGFRFAILGFLACGAVASLFPY